MPRRFVSVSLVFLLTAAACDDAAAPGDPDQVVPDTIPANASGVLLPGAPDARALDELRKMPPSPVPSDRIVNGLLTTRLDVVLNPAATVGQVNAALEATGARIVSMNPGHPFLTLVIPPAADQDDARRLGADLVASGAVVATLPAFRPGLPRAAEAAPPAVPPQIIGQHLADARFPAAWRAAALISAGAPKLPVLVPDLYYNTVPHPDISALSYGGDGGVDTGNDGEWYPGNHGFHVAGILAADHDDTLATGAHPLASAIQLLGLPNGGLSWGETLVNVRDRFPVSGKFLVSTSLGFIDSDFTTSKAERAILALNWRILTSGEVNRVLHLTAAGNDGTVAGDGGHSSFASPWTVAARFGDPRPMAFADGVEAADSTALEAVWGLVQTYFPAAAAPAPNIVIVGSVDPTFVTPSDFSSHEPDLWAVGGSVLGPCVKVDPGLAGNPALCDGALAHYDGTSMATPQVAALAAFLWNLEPTLSVAALKARLQEANDRGWMTDAAAGTALTDAYYAVLALDGSVGNAQVRPVLLDVVGSTLAAAPNGVFDQIDVEAFVTAFAGFDPSAADFSRYDLNGDGYAAGSEDFWVAPFDLDADGVSDITTVTQAIEGTPVSFAENSLTDLDILCYYAYSELYTGDPQARTTLLAQPCGADLDYGLELTFPDRIEPQTPTPLTVFVHQGGVPVSGAPVSFDVVNGTAGSDGTTGGGGTFTTNITLDADENQVEIGVNVALPDGSSLAATLVTLRPDEIILLPTGQGDANIYAGIVLEWIKDDSTVGPDFFGYKYDYADAGFVSYDASLSSEYTGADFGGTASASLTMETSGTALARSVKGTASASTSGNSDGPPAGYIMYAAGGEAGGSLYLQFQIWGAPTYTITASGDSNTTVTFGGFCLADGEPCDGGSGSAYSGVLQGGGVVSLNARLYNSSRVEDGTRSGAASLSFTLTITGTQASAAAPRARWAGPGGGTSATNRPAMKPEARTREVR